MPALRQAAWKPGSCPSPGARAAQRAQPPRQPAQALRLLRRSVPHFRSARLQRPARVGVAPGRTQSLPRQAWRRRAVGMVQPQLAHSVPLPVGQSIDLSAGECPRQGRDPLRRKTRRVSERTCSVSTGPSARLLGPYWDHGIAELDDLPGHSPAAVEHSAFLSSPAHIRLHPQADQLDKTHSVRFWHGADIRVRRHDVRFDPKRTSHTEAPCQSGQNLLFRCKHATAREQSDESEVLIADQKGIRAVVRGWRVRPEISAGYFVTAWCCDDEVGHFGGGVSVGGRVAGLRGKRHHAQR